MCANYTSIADVRSACGIASTEISDADVTKLILSAEGAINRYFNTSFVPKTEIETVDGTGIDTQFTRRGPLIRLIELKIDSTSITPDYVYISKSGKLKLSTNAEIIYFNKSYPQLISIKYSYGRVEKNEDVSTTTSNAEVAGDSTTVEVPSTTGLSQYDYISIFGMDGNQEITQINSLVEDTSLNLNLSHPHEAGSSIVLVEVPATVQRLAAVLTSLMMVARIVGQSYTDIVGYNIGPMHVQKGEPYTQWRETASQLDKERKILIEKIPITLAVA